MRAYLLNSLSVFSFVFLFYKFSFSFQFIIFAFLTFLLICVSVIDYFYKIIPIIFPVILVTAGVLSSFINLTLGETYLSRFFNSILGILIGGGVLFVAGLLGQFIYKKEAIGGGDINFMSGVGAFIGWEKVLFAIFIAAFLGGTVGLALALFKKIEVKGYILPFGPFLSVASFISIFLPQSSLVISIFFT